MAVDPTIMTWPATLAPKGIARRRIHPVNLGPDVLGGAAQSIVADAGRFGVDYTHVALYGTTRVMLFRAVIARLCAPLRPVYVPLLDYQRTPRAIAGIAGSHAIPYSDTSTFSDGSSFLDQPVDFIVAASAAARANVVTIILSDYPSVSPFSDPSFLLQAGQFIGLGERSYIVTQVFNSLTIPGATDCTIWPTLREAAAVNDPVWTEDPIIKCTVDPKIAELSEDMDLDRLGYIDVKFQEARW